MSDTDDDVSSGYIEYVYSDDSSESSNSEPQLFFKPSPTYTYTDKLGNTITVPLMIRKLKNNQTVESALLSMYLSINPSEDDVLTTDLEAYEGWIESLDGIKKIKLMVCPLDTSEPIEHDKPKISEPVTTTIPDGVDIGELEIDDELRELMESNDILGYP